MKKNLFFGLIFIALGLIIGLNALEITNIDLFFDGWWTLFIIVPSVVGLLSNTNITGNIVGLMIGVVLLLSAQNIIDFNIVWKLLLPAILMIIGISFIGRETFGKKINNRIKELSGKNKDTGYYATFGSQDLNLDGQKFNGTELSAVFGGIKLDLRKAKIESDVVINASAVFGGIELLVPEEVTIVVKSTPIFGGVEDKSRHSENAKAKTIYVNSICIFGGVEIK